MGIMLLTWSKDDWQQVIEHVYGLSILAGD